MKKTFIYLAAAAALMVGCKKNNAPTPMNADQQHNAIEEAATKFSNYVDVPNWSEDFDVLSEALTSFVSAEKDGCFSELNDYIDEITKNNRKDIKGIETSFLILSDYNAEVVVTKDSKTGGLTSKTTKKTDGGIKITFPSDKYGQCVVAFQASKDVAGKIRLKYEDSANVYVIPVSAQGTITVNGALRAQVGLKAEIESKEEYVDIRQMNDGTIVLEMTLQVGKYNLVINAGEKGMQAAALSETLYCNGELVEQISASLDGVQLPFEEGEIIYGNANVFVNVCNTVSLAGQANVEKFVPLAEELAANFDEGYKTKSEADEFAKKMTEALLLNVYYYNDLNYVQAHVEFSTFADKDDAEGGDIFVVRPVIVFADGARNTFEDFFNEDFINRLIDIVMPVIERIEEKLGAGEVD